MDKLDLRQPKTKADLIRESLDEAEKNIAKVRLMLERMEAGKISEHDAMGFALIDSDFASLACEHAGKWAKLRLSQIHENRK